MTINWLAILIATVLQFACGAIWYTALFGKAWGKIHGIDKYSKAEQQQMMKGMGPYYGLQILMTVVTTFVFALLLNGLPAIWNVYALAFHLWLGFVVPTQVSAVIFGGTEAKWIAKKIAIMAGGSLVCLMVAAAVLKMM